MKHSQTSSCRPYQREVLREFIRSNSRFWALLWERQSGKSTTLADFALYEMLRHKNHTVIYGSASLLLAQEITLKTAVRANQSVQQALERDAAFLKQFADTAQSHIDAQSQTPVPSTSIAELLNERYAAHQLKYNDIFQRNRACQCNALWPPEGDTSDFMPLLEPPSKPEFKIFDSQENREIKHYTASDFTSLFKQQRLEFRVYHSPTEYSRTKVIAPNIATARSWSGTVLLDEVAFIRNFRELITALLPVISTDKQFKLILSTTPPEFDDTHYSFELLAPPADVKFEPKAEGNWYTSQSQVRVHRADAFDTALAGKKIFDLKTENEISPAEAFQRAPNKDGHRIAHFLTWMLGGSAACDLARLTTAQERGLNQCKNFMIEHAAEMTSGLNWLSQNLGGRTNANNRPFHSPSPGGEGRGEGGLNTNQGGASRLSASTLQRFNENWYWFRRRHQYEGQIQPFRRLHHGRARAGVDCARAVYLENL